VSRPTAGARSHALTAWRFVKSLYHRFNRARIQLLAAALAYYAAFSLGPILLLFAGWLGVFLQRRPELASQYRNALTDLLAQLLPLQVDAADLVARSFDLVVGELSQGAFLSSIASLLVLVWASGNFFTSLQHALEVIFEVPEARAFWRKRLVAVLLVASVALVVAVEVVGGVAYSGLRQIGESLGTWLSNHGIALPDTPISFEPLADVRILRAVAGVSAFTLAFRYLPRRSSTWLGALIGGLVSSLGITVMRSLLIVTFNAERFNLVYGVIASLLAILLWLYLALLLTLVGAVVAAEISSRLQAAKGAAGAFAKGSSVEVEDGDGEDPLPSL
jgi:membrane protein